MRSEPQPPRHLRSSNKALQHGSALVAYTAATPCTNNGITIDRQYRRNLGCRGVLHIWYSDPQRRLLDHGYGVTFILLPGATIDTKGGGTLTLTAPTTAPVPRRFPRPFSLTPAYSRTWPFTMPQRRPVQFGGNSNINLKGNIYAPTAAVTFQGNPTINLGGGKSCGELIATSVAFNGNATLDDIRLLSGNEA